MSKNNRNMEENKPSQDNFDVAFGRKSGSVVKKLPLMTDVSIFDNPQDITIDKLLGMEDSYRQATGYKGEYITAVFSPEVCDRFRGKGKGITLLDLSDTALPSENGAVCQVGGVIIFTDPDKADIFRKTYGEWSGK